MAKTEFLALEFGDIDKAGRGSVLQHGGGYGCALHDLPVIIDSFGNNWKTNFELKE